MSAEILLATESAVSQIIHGESQAIRIRVVIPIPMWAPVVPDFSCIARVELYGIIDGQNVTKVANALHKACASREVKAIALIVDSPGGYAAGSAALNEAVREAAALKPVHCHIGSECCSGAMYAASGASSVTASEWSYVGSIGTVFVGADSTELYKKLGIKFVRVATGRYKALGADGSITEEWIQDRQRIVNSVNRLFLAAVAGGRKIPMTKLVTEIATGEVWIGREALERGLVDAVRPFSEWMSELEGTYGPEFYMHLEGADAFAKACELLSVSRLEDATPKAIARLQTRHPTLTGRALSHKPVSDILGSARKSA